MKDKDQSEQFAYDYIIIGAGASSPIVANSLVSDGYSVLLLEAGQAVAKDSKDVWDPQRWFKVQADETIEWGYTSIPQKNLNKRVLSMQQSRCLGGCTIHNAMVYVRGGQTTYDYWEKELGCKGWNYKSLEPLFEELEKEIGITSGKKDDLVNSFFHAAENNGIPYNKHYNQHQTEYGCVPFQFTLEEDGNELKRTTSYAKYIGDGSKLKGLTVVTGALVQQILFDTHDEIKAIGVSYENSENELITVHCAKEIILSAGTIASPKILLQSGVGPKEELEAIGIKVIKDLPAVGKNFYDDMGLTALFTQKQELPPQSYGFLTSGIFASDHPNFDPKNPEYAQVNLEMQICSSDLPGAPQIPLGIGEITNVGHDKSPNLIPLPQGDAKSGNGVIPYYSVGVAALHLKSRGSIKLASANPNDLPLIDPNYLSDPADMEQCKNAVKLALKIGWDKNLDNWRGMPLLPTVFPCATISGGWGWIGQQSTFDQYLEYYIRQFAVSIQHYIGTCSMGQVVDADLKVYGISGLRVIDASVAPTPVTGNTGGVSYVIGAKGAQLLKKR